ncbi:hypothetical protein N656DRAFT_352930 [Canariomyces notabilis]|uniref:Uncharacterized protein n=1 Tax=Canariomyces notabilis TaxID=2074819 RepID=A0AAN6QF12_9PEZI|nr:hypothetical protein N656DRAFT_352930 [Canariomyces arenarius]
MPRKRDSSTTSTLRYVQCMLQNITLRYVQPNDDMDRSHEMPLEFENIIKDGQLTEEIKATPHAMCVRSKKRRKGKRTNQKNPAIIRRLTLKPATPTRV